MNAFESVKESTKNVFAEYPKVNFDGSKYKIKYSESHKMFFMLGEDNKLYYFNITRGFINYLHTSTLKGFFEAKYAKSLLANGNFNVFCDYINDAKVKQIASGLKKSSKNIQYYLCIVSGDAYSLMVNYKPVHHTIILDAIAFYGLENRVSYANMTFEKMSVYIKSSHYSKIKADFGIHIINGMTGLNPLAFKSYIKVGSNFFSFPNYAFEEVKRKHLSFSSIFWDKVLEELQRDAEFEFITTINKFSSSYALSLLQGDTLEKLSEIYDSLVANTANGTALLVLQELSKHEDVHGLKMAVKEAIQSVIDGINEKWETTRKIF